MRLTALLILLAAAGSAAAVELPAEVEELAAGLLPTEVRSALPSAPEVATALDEERSRPSPHPPSPRESGRAESEDSWQPPTGEAWQHDRIGEDLPRFVQPAITEVKAVTGEVEETGLLADLSSLLTGVSAVLRPADPEAGVPGAVRTAAREAGVVAASGLEAASASAPAAAAVLTGAAVTVVPGSNLAGDLWRRLRALGLALAGYSRLERATLLDQEARQAIHAAVRETPGLATPAVAKSTKVGRTTATYHLRVLEREGYVVSRVVGRARHWFPVGETRPLAPEALALLQHPTTGRLAAAVQAEPGVDQSTLCARLGLSPSLAHWHLDRLAAAGIVAKARDGRRVRYTLTASL